MPLSKMFFPTTFAISYALPAREVVVPYPSATAVAVTARIEATANNGLGQRQAMNLREVRDRDAIYYLGEARIEERDELVFELVVTPEGGTPINARYRQEFWPAIPAR